MAEKRKAEVDIEVQRGPRPALANWTNLKLSHTPPAKKEPPLQTNLDNNPLSHTPPLNGESVAGAAASILLQLPVAVPMTKICTSGRGAEVPGMSTDPSIRLLERRNEYMRQVQDLNSCYVSWAKRQLKRRPFEVWCNMVEEYLKYGKLLEADFKDVLEDTPSTSAPGSRRGALAPFVWSPSPAPLELQTVTQTEAPSTAQGEASCPPTQINEAQGNTEMTAPVAGTVVMQTKLIEKLEKEAEKERKRREREEKKRQDELKRLEKLERKRQEEAEKEQKRLDKEKKKTQEELKRKQDEERRQQHEAALQKKKTSIRKSANFMDRFLRKAPETGLVTPAKEEVPNRSSSPSPTPKDTLFLPPVRPTEKPQVTPVHVLIDNELEKSMKMSVEEIMRSQKAQWQAVVSSQKPRPFVSWRLRRKPKRAVEQELGILVSTQSTPEYKRGKEAEDLEDEEMVEMESSQKRKRNSDNSSRKKFRLLQFHDNIRPAYYGTMSRRSGTVSGRRPFAHDAELDYDVESADEWEEEEPGESLSSSEKEDEEEAAPEEDEDDGFLVPEGYLSADEGVELDSPGKSTPPDSTPSSKATHKLDRMRALLDLATERALRTGKAFVVSALCKMAENGDLVLDLVGDQAYLKALAVEKLADDIVIEIPSDEKESGIEVQREKTARGPVPEHLVPEIINFLNSSCLGMAKLVEALASQYSGIAKKQLELKIRELAEYDNGRWQVKGQKLQELGLDADCHLRRSTPKELSPKVVKITSFLAKTPALALLTSE